MTKLSLLLAMFNTGILSALKIALTLLVGISLLTGCSSKPKKDYQVTTLQSVSFVLMEMADHKRQQGQFNKALFMYREAENYALKRNDKHTLALSMLKRAAIHIEQQSLQQARIIIDEVTLMNQHEALEVSSSIKFLEAKYAYESSDITTAVALLTQLQKEYATQPEKQIYYRLVTWVYQREAVSIQQIEKDIQLLIELKTKAELQNIEIYSYALFQQANYLAEQNDAKAEQAIRMAIRQVSELELSKKISDCYLIGAAYFQRQGQQEKSKYYQQQADNITSLILN